MNLDRRADLTADLLRDLELPAGGVGQGEALAGDAAAGAPAGGAVLDGAVADAPPGAGRSTPAVSLTLTPLRWSWPGVRRAGAATGVVVSLGPWSVQLSV